MCLSKVSRMVDTFLLTQKSNPCEITIIFPLQIQTICDLQGVDPAVGQKPRGPLPYTPVSPQKE